MNRKVSHQGQPGDLKVPEGDYPSVEQELKSVELLDKYARTGDLMYLRSAIKANPFVFFLDERMTYWIYEIRYRSIIPNPEKEYREAREFMEELRLLKPDKEGEVLIYFGSPYYIESCLGLKFIPHSKPQITCYDKAAMIFFTEKLKDNWKLFRNRKNTYRFKDKSSKRKSIVQFCSDNQFDISVHDLRWGSIDDATRIALTIIGIVNRKRFNLLVSHYPKHELGKFIKKFFSFQTLVSIYKKAKGEVSCEDVKRAKLKIETIKNTENPFVLDYTLGGMTSHMFLASPLSSTGKSKLSYAERVKAKADKLRHK